MKRSKGFTLAEVMVATAILTVVVTGVLNLLSNCLLSSERINGLSVFMFEAVTQMEAIVSSDYPSIKTAYTNNGALRRTVMPLTNNVDRSATVSAQELAANGLIQIKVVVCFKQKGILVGEDTNLNGILDAGEDKNGNNELDSACTVETVVANKV